jgi:hypothetical protein
LFREDDLKMLPDLGVAWFAVTKKEGQPTHDDPARVRLLETTSEDPV